MDLRGEKGRWSGGVTFSQLKGLRGRGAPINPRSARDTSKRGNCRHGEEGDKRVTFARVNGT